MRHTTDPKIGLIRLHYSETTAETGSRKAICPAIELLVAQSLQSCQVKSTDKLVTGKLPTFVALSSITSMSLMLESFHLGKKEKNNHLKCTNSLILQPTFRRGCWASLWLYRTLPELRNRKYSTPANAKEVQFQFQTP